MFSPLFKWKKTIHIVRGLPGSGKSTLALKLVNGNRDQVVENDDFWLAPPDVSQRNPLSYVCLRKVCGLFSQSDIDDMSCLTYGYEQQMTHIAGTWGWAETFRRLRKYDDVAVANVFALRRFIFDYVNEGMRLGVNIKIHQPTTAWADDVEKCLKKNIHGVPLEAIQRMRSQWEIVTQEEIDKLFETAKALDNV